MKNRLLLMALYLMIAPTMAFAEDQTALTDITKPIQLQPQQKELVFRLASNATTGYAWLLQSYDHQCLTLEKHSYIKPKAAVIGAPGMEEWHFSINPSVYLARQTGEIKLTYTQPWRLPFANSVTMTWVSANND